MNKKDLEKLGLTKEFLEKANLEEKILDDIIVLHGKDIETHKKKLETAEGEVATLKTQLDEANTQVAEFKTMDVDKIKQAATDWEAKAKAAEKERDTQINQLKVQHAIERELKETHGVIDPTDLLPRLKMDLIKLDGENIIGLNEQVEPLKKTKAYLFSASDESDDDQSEDDGTTPKLIQARKARSGGKPEVTLSQAIGDKLGVKTS